MHDQQKTLLHQSARGALWELNSQVIGQAIHLVIRLILARLLSPLDFGVIALAMVFVSFTWWFLDLGFGSALVQKRELTEEDRSTAFWGNVALGIAAAAALALAAPGAALFFRNDQLSPVIMVLSLSLLVSAPENTITAILHRDFAFRAIAIRKIAGTLLAGAGGIAMALAGFGVWALVAESLARSLLGFLFLMMQTPWRPRLIFDRKSFRELWGFGKPLVASRLLSYLHRNADTIIVGRALGTMQLGIYNLGYQFVLLPLTYISRSFDRVLLATLSRVQDDHTRFADIYLKSVQAVSSLTFPLMTVTALAGPALIPPLLGAQWAPAIPLIPVFCLIGMTQSVVWSMGTAFNARGESGITLRISAIVFGASVTAFIIGVRWGVAGVAGAYALSTLLVALYLVSVVTRFMNLRPGDFFRAVAFPACSAAAAGFFWICTGYVLGLAAPGLHPLIKCAAQLAATVPVVGYSAWKWNPLAREFRRFSDDHAAL